MKKIIFSFSIIIGLSQAAYSQQFTSTKLSTSKDIQDSSFRYLDKLRITSGVLLDRIFNWLDYNTLNGTKPISTSQVSQVWHELQLA